MKWLFNKHMQGHANEDSTFCHHFNNKKTSPFEKIGCMFLHQHTEIFIFGVKCQNKLYQFKQVRNTDNGNEEQS